MVARAEATERPLGVDRRAGNFGSLRDHHDASLRDVEALAVLLLVEADLGARRDLHSAVDDDPAEARVAPHVDAVHEHAFLDVGERVDPHAREQDRAVNRAARDDASRCDGRVGRDADALGNRVREHELRRRLLRGVALERPLVVVEVQRRRDGDQIHRGIPVGIHRAHVAPVRLEILGSRDAVRREVVRVKPAAAREQRRDDRLAKVVGRVLERVVLERVDQDARAKDVIAHRRERHLGVGGHGPRPAGFS